MTKKSLLSFFGIVLPICLSAQLVWPGDVNNNGEVSEADLLFLGFAYGETGPQRSIISDIWEGQPIISEWEGSFPGGLNFAFADCNGDGIVDEKDAAVIEKNIGLQHDDVSLIPDEVLPALPGVHPKITFLTETLDPIPGFNLRLEVGLGENELPVDNLLGVHFTIKVEEPIDVNRAAFIFNDTSWIDPDPESTLIQEYRNKEAGTLDIVYTRTDKVPVNGSGLLGVFAFIIEAEVLDLFIKDTLTIGVDSITLTADDLEKIPVEPGFFKIPLPKKDSFLTANLHPVKEDIAIFPNPSDGKVLIISPTLNLEKISLINSIGQMLQTTIVKHKKFQDLNLEPFPAGVYWLKIYTEQGLIAQQVRKL